MICTPLEEGRPSQLVCDEMSLDEARQASKSKVSVSEPLGLVMPSQYEEPVTQRSTPTKQTPTVMELMMKFVEKQRKEAAAFVDDRLNRFSRLLQKLNEARRSRLAKQMPAASVGEEEDASSRGLFFDNVVSMPITMVSNVKPADCIGGVFC